MRRSKGGDTMIARDEDSREVKLFRFSLDTFTGKALVSNRLVDAAAINAFVQSTREERTELIREAEKLGLDFVSEASRSQERVNRGKKELQRQRTEAIT